MTRLKDKSQSVIQTVQHSMSTRELNFHCITERLAAMSFPTEGLELGTKNHIDDVAAIIESRHASKYMILNLSERSYDKAKFPTGKVVVGGWKTSAPTPLETVLKSVVKTLDFLAENPQHIAVVHCLDGKSNTAVLVVGVLMAVGFVQSFKDGLKFFALKRCDAALLRHQITTLRYLESVYVSSPSPSLELSTISINSVILEPIPLFNKGQDGCRPYVEVGSGVSTIPATFDYQSLKQFTTYDEEAILRVNGMKMVGDVSLSVHHARQTLGSFLSSSKYDGIPICKLYFHTSFLPQNSTCVKFKIKDLDGIGYDANGQRDPRIPASFKVVVNYRMEAGSKANCIQTTSNVKYSLGLIFASQAEHENNHDMMVGSNDRQTAEGPVAPPRSTSKAAKTSPETPVPPPKPEPVEPVKEAQVPLARPASDTLLLDLGFDNGQAGSAPETPSMSHAASSPSHNIVEDLLNIQKPSPDLLNPTQTMSASNSSNDLLLGDFGGVAPPAPSVAPATNNLLGDFFPKAPAAEPVLNPSKPSTADDLVNNLLEGLTVNQNSAKSQPPPSKPNYNSSFFNASKPAPSAAGNSAGAGAGIGKRVTEDAFNDLLGGFTATSSSSSSANEAKTIGEMKKREEMKTMTEDEAKIFRWRDGKARNLRALLCSLDTVLWEGARWSKCGMHQLVTANDVKKMYRKACLAVHPDKQVGTENEELSKLIFMELNDAWSDFDKGT